MKIYVYRNKLSNFEEEIEAESQEQAHQIFLKKHPSVAVIKYGLNKPIHAILDWSFQEKKF